MSCSASSDDSLTPTPTVIRLSISEERDWRDSSTPIPAMPRRSPDSFIIFVLGKTGVGRSSLLNSLFADPRLCPVPSGPQVHPRVTSKLLIIPEDDGPRSVSMTIVNIHSSLVGYYSATHFLQTHPTFSSSPSIVPNLVLFVFDAANNHSLETLPLELRGLNKLNILNNNLIVVVTNAEALVGRTEREYKINTGRLEFYLQRKIAQYLPTSMLLPPTVRVVFVDSDPSILKKSGDFHVLPNGELMPLNLSVGIMDLLEEAEDSLGSLSFRWYFKLSCPDREFQSTSEFFPLLNANTPTNDGQMLPEFASDCFLSTSQTDLFLQHEQIPLGFGFCPVSGASRVCLTNPLATEDFLLSNKMFKFPEEANVESVSKDSIKAHVLPSGPSEENKILSDAYGIPSSTNLFVKGMYPPRAYRNCYSLSLTEKMPVLYTQITRDVIKTEFTLDNPKSSIFNPVFLRYLSTLPDKYDRISPSTRLFVQFFSYFGSHLVTKVPLGGSVTLRAILDKSDFRSNSPQQVEKTLEDTLKWTLVLNTKVGVGFKETPEHLGIMDGTIRCVGGDTSLMPKTLLDLTPQIMHKWEASVEVSPSPLWEKITLFPFYDLIDSESNPARHAALKTATKEYLEGTITSTTGLVPLRNNSLEGLKPISPSPEDVELSTSAALRLRRQMEEETADGNPPTPFSIVPTPSPPVEIDHPRYSPATRRRRGIRRHSSSVVRPRFFCIRPCCHIL